MPKDTGLNKLKSFVSFLGRRSDLRCGRTTCCLRVNTLCILTSAYAAVNTHFVKIKHRTERYPS